jgi:hypothetical protein
MDVHGSSKNIDEDLAIMLNGDGVCLAADGKSAEVMELDAEQTAIMVITYDRDDVPNSQSFEYGGATYDGDPVVWFNSNIIDTADVADRLAIIKLYKRYGLMD